VRPIEPATMITVQVLAMRHRLDLTVCPCISRPTHWGAAPHGGKGTSKAARPNPASSLLSFNQTQKSKLADALDRRPRAAIAIAAKTQPAESNKRRAHGPLGPTLAPDPPSSARTEQTPNTSSSLAPISFVPSFLAKATPYVSATKDEAREVEDADDVVPMGFEDGIYQGPESAAMAGPHSPNPTATGAYDSGISSRWERPMSPFPASPMPATRRRNNNPRDKGGSASAGGFLVRRLKSLRDATKADTIRLQSYGLGAGADRHLISAAPSSYFVMNDPRSKAESHMDLTLVGDECWACDPQHEKITYLAYCHSHHVRSQARSAPAKAMAELDPSTPSSLRSNEFLLLCVTFATARERDLPSTRNLRVYNPIVVSVVPSGEETVSSASLRAKPMDTVAKHVVLATYLCEPFPDGLPALPEPPSFSTALQE
jgi:hypothetical protein